MTKTKPAVKMLKIPYAATHGAGAYCRGDVLGILVLLAKKEVKGMPIIDLTDVVGIREESGRIACVECLDTECPGWERGVSPHNFITRTEIEDPEMRYVCDRACGEPLG